MDKRFWENVEAELGYIYQRFPGNKHNLAALFEETGELSNALIDHDRGKKSGADVYVEAVQAAAVAAYIALKGSEEFGYQHDEDYHQQFMTLRFEKTQHPSFKTSVGKEGL